MIYLVLAIYNDTNYIGSMWRTCFGQTMARKIIRVTLTVALVMRFLGTGVIPTAGSCDGPCCCSMLYSRADAKSHGVYDRLSGPGCGCCNAERPGGDFSQGCPLKTSDWPYVAVIRAAEKPTPEVVTGARHTQIYLAISEAFAQEMWPAGSGLPFPLFLFNQSFLC
jgi:hypothetical protein